MCPLTYLPSLFSGILFPRFNQSFLGKFLIVDLDFGVEILRGCSSPSKISRMLLFISIVFSMSERCFLEHRRECCLVFP